MEVNRVNAEKKNKKEAKRHQEQEKKDQMERQKKENELRKNFQVRNQQYLSSTNFSEIHFFLSNPKTLRFFESTHSSPSKSHSFL